MAVTKAEIMQAISDEATEVKTRLDALEARIAELVAAGGGATEAEMQEILAGVKGIFKPD